MKTINPRFLAALASLCFAVVCQAGVSAVVIIHQPIITASEAVTIETPKGFSIMPIPFVCFHYQGRPPFDAITQPNPLLTDAPRSILSDDSNLLSRAGVAVASSIEDDIVYVRFENVRPPTDSNITADDIAEATIECIRRMAQGAKSRPILKISGKPGDEAKWLRWQEHFQKHDLAKPFNRPNT